MKIKTNARRLKCPCGKSEYLTATDITIRLHDVPFALTADGPEYDDGEAAYSEGWNYNEENNCRCTACGTRFIIAADKRGRPYLEQQPEGDAGAE